jgi:biopolymer transport protein ExbD
MSKFKPGGKKDEPEVSTASLPDIIFMLLFFFMVVTVMRESELKIKVKTPQATELTKLQEKSLVNYIHIGRPTQNYQEQYGTSPKIQLGDKISDIEDIPLFLENHKASVPEKLQFKITTSLKVDSDVTMGIVTDVKEKLRKSGQVKVNYSAKKRTEDL